MNSDIKTEAQAQASASASVDKGPVQLRTNFKGHLAGETFTRVEADRLQIPADRCGPFRPSKDRQVKRPDQAR
jgi:hypothetical protein